MLNLSVCVISSNTDHLLTIDEVTAQRGYIPKTTGLVNIVIQDLVDLFVFSPYVTIPRVTLRCIYWITCLLYARHFSKHLKGLTKLTSKSSHDPYFRSQVAVARKDSFAHMTHSLEASKQRG